MRVLQLVEDMQVQVSCSDMLEKLDRSWIYHPVMPPTELYDHYNSVLEQYIYQDIGVPKSLLEGTELMYASTRVPYDMLRRLLGQPSIGDK